MVLCKGEDGETFHELARISIVNYDGLIILDKFVKPSYHISNYFIEFFNFETYIIFLHYFKLII
jgi:hypothetical protein